MRRYAWKDVELLSALFRHRNIILFTCKHLLHQNNKIWSFEAPETSAYGKFPQSVKIWGDIWATKKNPLVFGRQWDQNQSINELSRHIEDLYILGPTMDYSTGFLQGQNDATVVQEEISKIHHVRVMANALTIS